MRPLAMNRTLIEADGAAKRANQISSRRKRVYAIVGLALAAYMVILIYLTSVYLPNIQWYSYYVINYGNGFVRRGLAGEILDLFSPDHYFTGLLLLRWLVPVIFVAGLVAVAWRVAVGAGNSQRSLMLALLIPLLPFGFVHAVVLPTPNLLGATVLTVFAVALTSLTTDRAIVLASAAYGFTTALLTLIHEAIPFLYSLGAIAAIVVLVHSSIHVQRLSASLATVPGLVVALSITLLGHRDVASQCDRLPHKPMDSKLGLSLSQILDGQHAYKDFHDWTCRVFVTRMFDRTPLDMVGGFTKFGLAPWIMSTIFGIAVFAMTILLIRGVSGVPFGQFCTVLRTRALWVFAAALLVLPLYATTSDWVRWWVAVSFDIALIYLLYASVQPESKHLPTQRTRVLFTVAIVLLALFPSGTIANVGVVQRTQFLFDV